jgi:hypothetical protein
MVGQKVLVLSDQDISTNQDEVQFSYRLFLLVLQGLYDIIFAHIKIE